MELLIFVILPIVAFLGYLAYKQRKADNEVLISSANKSFVSNPYLRQLIEADDDDLIADEQFRISVAYQNGGNTLPKDNDKAMNYCRKAAERGHVVAQLFMAQWLMNLMTIIIQM